jgi:hypothetical protein
MAATLLLPARSLVAQTPEPQKPNPEVQQLRERLLQLEQTVELLKTQITSLEAPQKKDVATGERISASATAAVPVTVTIPAAAPKPQGGESTFEVYGFAMLDAGYQFKQNDPNWFDVVRPTKLPSFKDEFAPDGNTFFGVRQSRLGVRSSTPNQIRRTKNTI